MITPEAPAKALPGYDPPEWALGDGDTDVLLLRMTWSLAVREGGKTTRIIDISQQPRFVIGREEVGGSLDPAANLGGGLDSTVSRYTQGGDGGGSTIYITTINSQLSSACLCMCTLRQFLAPHALHRSHDLPINHQTARRFSVQQER